MGTTVEKVCSVCGKDVSAIKRVKDAVTGKYFCQGCHEKAVAAAAAAAAKRAEGEYDLAEPVAVKPKVKQTVVAAVAEGSGKGTAVAEAPKRAVKLPDFCPNCDAPVLPNRKMCIKCGRDVTLMEEIAKRKAAEAAKGDSAEEKIGNWVGRIAKVALILFVIGVIAFSMYGLYMMFINPPKPFDDYPLTRGEAVNEFLDNVAAGTEASYKKAFLVTSFRERATNNDQEEDHYKTMFKRINKEFTEKYGADWRSKAKVVNDDPADNAETTVYLLQLGDDVYHVLPSVQITVEQGVLNRTIRRDIPTYPENGKNHFGVIGIAEYSVHGTSKTIDMQAGPGKPEPLPFEMPKGNGQ